MSDTFNRLHQFKRFFKLTNLALFSVVLLVGFYLASYPKASTKTSGLDLSTITVTARPSAEHADEVNSANEVKEATIKEEETSSTASPAADKSVCLDPGHGGIDPGATKGKITESDINLIVAKKAKTLLEEKGYAVFMTRTDDESLSKMDRYSFCNNKDAAVLVAVHHNSYTSGTVNYSTALYYTENDQLLAESIAQSTSKALKLENKGIAWFDNSVLKKSKMPAVFSEASFLTNSSDYTKLAKKDYSRLYTEAAGIVDGIINYFADPTQFKPTFASEELEIDRTDW